MPTVVLDVGAVSLTGLDVSPGCSVRQVRGAGCLLLAHAGALQLEAVGTVDNAIQNCVAQSHVADDLMPAGYHVLDNVAKHPFGLVLTLSREELRPSVQRPRMVDETPISRSRPDRPGGDGDGDGRAAQDGPAVQPGGGLRAAAGRSDHAHAGLPATTADLIASNPSCAGHTHEGEGG